jgi:hypothetical protein
MARTIIIPSTSTHPDNHVGGQPGPPVELPKQARIYGGVDAEQPMETVRGLTPFATHVPVTTETAPSTINANVGNGVAGRV